MHSWKPGGRRKSGNKDAKTDFFSKRNSVRDSVAIDTVETLLSGYQLDSAPWNQHSGWDRINKPAHRPAGIRCVCQSQAMVTRTYPAAGRSYPFENGWGNAKIQDDFNAPVDVKVSCKREGTGYVFEYTASEPTPCIHKLARIDLLVNGTVVQRIFDNLNGGRVAIDLAEYRGQNVRCRIAAWDMALNCTLSEETEMKVD